VDRCIVVNSTLSCTFHRDYGHQRRTSSRFKWPLLGYMPSRTPYQMFPAISTPAEAKEFVSYRTKNERLLILSELQKFQEEKCVDGLYSGLSGNATLRIGTSQFDDQKE